MTFQGDLCSGTRSCQAPSSVAQPVDAKPSDGLSKGPKAFWNSLQSFSFVRWCSRLLGDVLASGTPFAAFVRKTLHTSRSPVVAPAKALFPLPFPKFGLFGRRSPRQSSRARRKLAFDQAFHIFVAALNFLHADCAFPPLDLLVRTPSSAQWQALWNLRNIFKAFGNSGEEFQVPRSGRRSTNLVSGLCDLTEFLTRSGASSDAYFHGFAGDGTVADDGATLKPDLSRADELIPYRKLDAERIKLSGEANWDPSPYLEDDLLLPYLEPNVLIGQSGFDPEDLPDLGREDPDQVLALAKLWDVKGLLRIRPDVVEEDLQPSCLRCFNCYKDELQDRLIGDRRGRNQLEATIPGPSRFLPTGPALAVLEVPPGFKAVVCATDLKDYYHQLRVTSSRSRCNALWPPIPLSVLQSSKAYDFLLEDLKKRKRWTREERGDGLGALAGGKPSSWKALGKVGSTSLVHACFNTVAQGDHLGVEFATASHRNLLKDRGLLVPEEEIVSNRPYGGGEVLQGLVIDDFFSVSIERAESDNLRSRSKRRFDVAKQTYAKEGLMGSPLKDIVGQQKAKIAGAEVDSSDDALKLGIVPLGSPVAKRLALALVSLEVTRLRYTTNSLHACLLGGWTAALMFRRPLMSVLFASHKLIDTSALNASRPRVVTLPRGSAQELLLLAVLAPAMCSDLSIPFSEKLFCTDSSDAKGAVVSTTVSPDLSRYLWKVGSKKGGYARLLTREEALLRRLSLYDGSEEFSSGDVQVGFEKPRKSPLLRFDFIELCGGASKVSAELSKLGWVVGPCLDLDSSAHFDLSSLDLWRWVVHLLEAGLLDGFMVQPPCTTFSPAQHPALRSYELPRGFCPCEARTLLGTCLALRSLSLMMVAARIGAIGLLEQIRRSKMAWLPEWRRLLGEGWAHEEWRASCMYGSPHQKEFRFLVTNLESAELHRKCDGQHAHIKIEGKYTKASAIYTDQLAQSLAACISKGLRRKKAVAAYHFTQDSGLESIVMNDLLLSSTWRVEDQWHWKSPAHINIHESAAVLRLLKTQAISFPRSRFAVGVDSHVALSALAKGRSPSYGLRPVLRRSACLCVAGCLYPSFSFAPTRMNPADCPTRDVCFPDPVREGFAKHLDSASLLVLAPVSGLRRFLSNWARLVLVLLQGRLCSWTWGDSGRFSHYSKSAYPYGWSCSRKAQLKDFDATLGFPGEGPLWVCRFCLLLFSSSVSCFLPSSFGRLCLSLSLSFTHSREPQGTFLAAAAPPAVSHGVLEPRDRGDVRRAADRSRLLLTDGRPVQPKTKDNREVLLTSFDNWLRAAGCTLPGLIDGPEPDIDRINNLLESYGRELFRAGTPYNHFAETLNGISSRRPRLRRCLQQAWNLAVAWLREEPGSHHVAIPWQCLIALVTTAWTWGWIDVAGILALSWGGVTRIGEATSAYRKNLLLPSDFGWTIGHVLLQITEAKTRFKAARHQVAKVDQPQLVYVLELAFKNHGPFEPLWPHSGQTLRGRFGRLLSAVGLAGPISGGNRGLDLGSLRAGGATWLLQACEDSELVRRRGRWLNSRTMEIYIQETSALQFLPSLPKRTRDLILLAVAVFPQVLAKFREFDSLGIPRNAWHLLMYG